MSNTAQLTGFASYPAYKESGVLWLGEIPSHWEVLRMKFSVENYSKKVDAQSSVFKYLGLENLESFTGKLIDTESKSEGLANEFKCNDVLFGKLRPYLSKVHLAKYDGLVSTEALVFRAQKKLEPNYLFYYCLSPDFINIVNASTFGSKMPRADWKNISILPCTIPSIKEQQAIVQFLDKQLAYIDALVNKQKQLIKKLAEQRSAMISHAVTKGLDPNVPMKESGVEWLGKVPEHWIKMSLKYSLDMPITDGPHETPEILTEGIPFISAEAVKNDKLDFNKKRGYISKDDYDKFSKKYIPKFGDIYMVKSGATTGNIAKVETDIVFNIWSPLAVMRPNKDIVSTNYLFYILKSSYFNISVQLMWNFGTQQNIGMGVLSNINIICPTLIEQQKIVDYLDKETKKIDQITESTTKIITKLQEYRSALITQAVTGKIDVRDLVNNDVEIPLNK